MYEKADLNGESNSTISLGPYTGSYIGITNDATQTNSHDYYLGGAISIVNDQTLAINTTTTTITVDEITGYFISNSIEETFNTIYQGNGGAIGLFANEGGIITVNKITGDFIDNSASRVGGAIYLFTNNDAVTYVKEIEGNFIDNTAGAGAGAIANYEAEIGTITGDFIGNTANAGGGGAIDNLVWSNQGGHTATTTSIYGNFIGNTAGTGSAIANGGAIRNFAYSYISDSDVKTIQDGGGEVVPLETGSATIGEIIGSFIGNEATGDGGAIYNYAHTNNNTSDTVNTAIISTITGNFIGNSAGGSGGAIYNDDNYSSIALIGVITGDFICNTADLYGGAIYNTSQIDYINGNFVNNSAEVIGGAIYNKANGGEASLGDIVGSFIGNSVTATASIGGAIANYSAVADATATIGDITGDFIANSATKYGGAIYNDSNKIGDVSIGTITGDFLYNCVIALSGTTGNVNGGAIYNNDTIGAIEGSFIGNYVIGATDNTVAGGAIYTTADISFTATDQTNYFSDNYTAYYDDANSTVGYKEETTVLKDVDYNAIYVGIDTITDGAGYEDIGLSFTMSGSGSFVMNDSIIGATSYTLLEVEAFDTLDAGTLSTSTTSVSFKYYNTGDTTSTGTAVEGWNSKEVATTTTTNTSGDGTTTTTTVATVTTTYSDSNDSVGTTTKSYISTITVTDSDGNTTSITNTEDEASNTSGGNTSATTTTTYTITGSGTDKGNSATYTTDNAGNTTTAKTVVVNADGTVTTTTYNLYTDASTDTVGVSTATSDTLMTGTTAFNMDITGDSKDKNIFYLNDEITNFGELTITNATLYLSDYLHADEKTTTVGSLTALDSESSVKFVNSQLTIDMSAYTDSMSTDGSIPTTAVLTGNGANLSIDDSSKLTLLNVSNGSTFTILLDFDVLNTGDIQTGDDGPVAWNMNNVSIDSNLYTFEIIKDGYDDTITVPLTDSDGKLTGQTEDQVAYVISFKVDEEAPLIQDTSLGELVYNAAADSSFGADSSIAGERFLYDVSTMTNVDEELVVAEGAASLAKVAGVPTTTYSVNRLASDALSSRLSRLGDTDTVLASYSSDMSGTSASTSEDEGIGRLSNKEKSVALWFVPMYGHDKVTDANVANYDAEFVTNIYGGVAGIDKTIEDGGVNAFGADLYRVGVAVHAGMGETSTSGTFDYIENDFNYGGAFVYGVAEWGNFTLSADAGFTRILSELNQDLSRYGFAGTEADVYSHAWSVDVRAEYCIESDDLNIIPYIGAEFLSMKTEDYAVK